MKGIFFSLFLLIILNSCSKSEKETALELCADSNYLKRGNISKDLKVEVESLIEKDEVYQEVYQNENRLDKIIIDKENYLKELANKFLLENPKPIAKKIEEVIDLTRDDLTVEEVKKTKIKIKDNHMKDIENWKKNSSIYLFKAVFDKLL